MQFPVIARPRQCYTAAAVICATLLLLSFLSLSADEQAIAPIPNRNILDTDPGLLVPLTPERPATNTDLVLFAYHETDNTKKNLQFFLDHALHGKADFIFIINGDELNVEIPVADNIQVIHRPNTCYDLGAFGEVLQANNGTLKEKYKRFIMLNGSIRGPFLPHWSRKLGVCWSDIFLEALTDDTKLAGMSANCDSGCHIQSMILSTDRIGLDLIMPGLACAETMSEAVYQGEVTLLHRILEAGYYGEPIHSLTSAEKFEGWSHFWDTCDAVDVFFPHGYDGMDIHPFDTVFVKSQRLLVDGRIISPYTDDGQRVVDRLTEWADRNEYSSYDYCK